MGFVVINRKNLSYLILVICFVFALFIAYFVYENVRFYQRTSISGIKANQGNVEQVKAIQKKQSVQSSSQLFGESLVVIKATSSQFTVVGTFTSKSPQLAAAVIDEKQGGEVSIYRIDEVLPGDYVLRKIEKEGITVEKNGQFEMILLNEDDVVEVPSVVPPHFDLKQYIGKFFIPDAQ